MGRGATSTRGRARLLLVLVALVGLFLMHGLSDHGMTRPVTAESSPDHSAHADVATGDHDQRASAPTADPAVLPSPVKSGPDETATALQVTTSSGTPAEPPPVAAVAATIGGTPASVAALIESAGEPGGGQADEHGGQAGEHGGQAGEHGGGHLMMVGLCLALLIAAVCLLPMLRSVVIGRRIRTFPVRSQAWPARLVYRPPDLVALGVCRC